jgi:excisionase family DNA binding protein
VTAQTDPHRLSVREAAERAGVSQKMVRRAIERGELPGFMVRGMRKVIVLEADVDRVFALERIEPRERRPAPIRSVPARRPPGRGSREALRSIEGRASNG